MAGLPFDSVEDRVSRLHLNSASNTQTVVDDKRPVGKESLTVPGVEERDDNGEIMPSVKLGTRKVRGENTMCSPPATGGPGEPQVKLDQLFEKMLPAFIKIVKPSVPKFSGIPLEYLKFKAAFKLEVYDATEKLKFLLDAVEGNAKSCLAKFMPGSDKYMEVWTALDERFGRVDTVVSAAKRRVDQFPIIVKENSEQIRQYQEMVLELMGVYKEHNFVHELNSQIPEANVAKLPVRLCGRWAEFVEGKSKRSTWESFANWLEKEAKLYESKQRWMPEKREWRRFDSTRSDLPKSGSRKSSGNPVPGLFAEATQETQVMKSCQRSAQFITRQVTH